MYNNISLFVVSIISSIRVYRLNILWLFGAARIIISVRFETRKEEHTKRLEVERVTGF